MASMGPGALPPRVSDVVLRKQNQPDRRGHEPGTHQRVADREGGNAYSVKTLVGHWWEEQADTRFDPRKPRLRSDLDRQWQTMYGHDVCGRRAEVTRIKEPHVLQADESKKLEISLQQGRCFPGHQAGRGAIGQSVAASTYSDPRSVPFTMRRWTGEQVEAYTNTWTRSTEAEKSRIQSESRRQYTMKPGADTLRFETADNTAFFTR